MSLTTVKTTEKAPANAKVYDAALQQKVNGMLERKEVSQNELAKVCGSSSTAISQWRRGIYDNGDPAEVERKLREYFRTKEEREEVQAQAAEYQIDESYKPTSLSEHMYQSIRFAQIRRKLVILHGDAGAGKTSAADKYTKDNPSSTIKISLTPSMAGSVGVAEKLCEKLDIPLASNRKMWCAIHAKLRGTNRLVIVDEAQLLKKEALEEIRAIPEMIDGIPGNGVVLIGNSELYHRIERAEIKSQMFTRIGFHCEYKTARLTNEDIRMLFPMFAGEDKKDELKLIATICRSKNSIRTAKNVVETAIYNQDVSYNGLRAALAATGKGRL